MVYLGREKERKKKKKKEKKKKRESKFISRVIQRRDEKTPSQAFFFDIVHQAGSIGPGMTIYFKSQEIKDSPLLRRYPGGFGEHEEAPVPLLSTNGQNDRWIYRNDQTRIFPDIFVVCSHCYFFSLLGPGLFCFTLFLSVAFCLIFVSHFRFLLRNSDLLILSEQYSESVIYWLNFSFCLS